MQKIIGAKKIGENGLNFFSCGFDVKLHDKIVVEANEFQTIAEVTETETNVSKSADDFGKAIRFASKNDLEKFETLKSKAKKELPQIKKKSLELGLMMKFVQAEYSLDGSKILIVFSSEERVDFRQLLKDLASSLKTRIELKQIGQRDEVKMLGGVGPCGEPCCCARFLKDFEHVTVKQAKIQGLSLSPTKINGVCGRLMCCLGYESKMYEEILSKMPKVNSEVETPNGKGTVVYNDILRERVSVKRQAEGDTIVVEEFELYEIKGFGVKPEVKQVDNSKNESKEHVKNKDNFSKQKDVQGRVEEIQKTSKQKDFHSSQEKQEDNKPQEITLGLKPRKQEKDGTSEEKKDNKKFHHKRNKKFFNKNNKK